jgi:hypothetical protein
MKFIVLLLCFCLLPIHVFSADEKNTIKVPELNREEATQIWIKTVSEDVAIISSDLRTITPETPKEKVNEILEEALKKVQKMRTEAAKRGVILEGFSINLAFPPSMTVDFKFKD